MLFIRSVFSTFDDDYFFDKSTDQRPASEDTSFSEDLPSARSTRNRPDDSQGKDFVFTWQHAFDKFQHYRLSLKATASSTMKLISIMKDLTSTENPFTLTSNSNSHRTMTGLLVPVEGNGKGKRNDNEGMRNNVGVITQPTVIRDDSLLRHALSSSPEESAPSSRLAAGLQKFGISSTHQQMPPRSSVYGNFRPPNNRPNASTTWSNSLDQRNDINRMSDDDKGDGSDNQEGNIESDRNTITRLRITRKRRLPLKHNLPRKRHHRRLLVPPTSSSNNSGSSVKSHASNYNSIEYHRRSSASITFPDGRSLSTTSVNLPAADRYAMDEQTKQSQHRVAIALGQRDWEIENILGEKMTIAKPPRPLHYLFFLPTLLAPSHPEIEWNGSCPPTIPNHPEPFRGRRKMNNEMDDEMNDEMGDEMNDGKKNNQSSIFIASAWFFNGHSNNPFCHLTTLMFGSG